METTNKEPWRGKDVGNRLSQSVHLRIKYSDLSVIQDAAAKENKPVLTYIREAAVEKAKKKQNFRKRNVSRAANQIYQGIGRRFSGCRNLRNNSGGGFSMAEKRHSESPNEFSKRKVSSAVQTNFKRHQPQSRSRKMKEMKKPARRGQMEKTLKMIAEIGKSMTIEELAKIGRTVRCPSRRLSSV